ncbi:MAG: NUDIX hydrolase [Cyanobacteria bacterium J06554_11]
MNPLTNHQKAALAQYRQLIAEHPNLFGTRALRPIVRDFDLLEAYAAEHSTVLGVAAATPYSQFVVDLVESQLPDGTLHRFPYQRLISASQLKGGINVVILATIENPQLGNVGDVVLLEEERHATGTTEIGLPRGFGEAGLSGEQNALKELREESGYGGEKVSLLGSAYIDTGVTDSKIFYYHVAVTNHMAGAAEHEEAITNVSLVSLESLWESVRSGELQDSFTLQALAFYQSHQNSKS